MSHLYELAAVQMLLYAGLWTCAWVIVRAERPAVVHLIGFSLLIAAGLGLISLRPGGDPWLTGVLANWMLVSSVALFWRGGALFLRLPVRDGEMALVLAATVALMVWLGPQPRQGLWRHPGFVSAAAIAWILAATAWRGHAALTRQFGQRTAWVVTGTLSAFAALQAVRVVHALSSTASVPMHQAHAANLTLVYSMLIAAAVLNMVHLFLMVLRLLRRLTDLVDRDALTGLLNRRAVEQALVQQWAGWRRSGRPFAVISLDLDHFKQVNDRWGHSAGDEVLRATAALLQRGVREVDLVARVGGEEFLILLPGHDAASALVSAERLRGQLAQAEVSLPGGAALRVTCSAGVAEVGGGDAAPEQLLQRADRALYQAKRDGRDRVVSAVPDGSGAVSVTVFVTNPSQSRT